MLIIASFEGASDPVAHLPGSRAASDRAPRTPRPGPSRSGRLRRAYVITAVAATLKPRTTRQEHQADDA
jgi:hypothetical protein